jgi:hypothetical protein
MISPHMGTVVQFRLRRGPWLPSEQEALVFLSRALSEYCPVSCQHGRADDDTPWVAYYYPRTGELVAQVTRYQTGYMLMWPDRTWVRVPRLEKLARLLRWTGQAVANAPIV